MEELKVNEVIIGKQFENCENLNKFTKIINEKKIKVNAVEAGTRINIEKNVYIDILWPQEQSLTTNVLNNNAIVCNLHYKDFSMLFTGDIEEVAEDAILKLYSNNLNLLKSTVLKVAHHGSKTSTTSEFLNVVSPKTTIIGVGENNNFGHPNEEVLKRLKNYGCRIYRTDINGEISIEVNGKSEYKVTALKTN